MNLRGHAASFANLAKGQYHEKLRPMTSGSSQSFSAESAYVLYGGLFELPGMPHEAGADHAA